jgi:putative SOS response-associated peptidase YedK
LRIFEWVVRRRNTALPYIRGSDCPRNGTFEKIHDRMPFVALPDRAEQWLDRKVTDAGTAMELPEPNPDDAIAFYRVGPRVNNARNQGADLIKAV